VVKVATDVTDQKLNGADFAGHIDAIGKSQTVIEFNMDGTIGTANANFLGAVGYSLGEITGKHHSPFVETSERDSAGYREFWNGLNRGRYQAGEYKRIGKGGKENLDSGLLQSDPRSEWKAVQDREIPNRHHRSGRCA
jgi:methyl-accepting chemotaxis protein